MEKETRTIEDMITKGISVVIYERDYDRSKTDIAFPDNWCNKALYQMEQQGLSDRMKNFLEVLTKGEPVKEVLFRHYDILPIILENGEQIIISNEDVIKGFKKYLRQQSWGQMVFKYKLTSLNQWHEILYGDLGSNIRVSSIGKFILEPIFWIIRDIDFERRYN